MRTAHPILFAVVFSAVGAASSVVAQKPSTGVNGKTACGLMSAADVRKAANNASGIAVRVTHMDEDTNVSSNCQYWGTYDITLHIGTETKVMFGRVRENYAKAPAKLGYTVERISGLGDDAYYLVYNGKVELRALRGETELAVSLSGTLPPDAKKIALSIAKAAAAKL